MAVRQIMQRQFLTTQIHNGVSASGLPKYYNKNIVMLNDVFDDETLEKAYLASVKFAGFYDNTLANVYQSTYSELEESVGGEKK